MKLAFLATALALLAAPALASPPPMGAVASPQATTEGPSAAGVAQRRAPHDARRTETPQSPAAAAPPEGEQKAPSHPVTLTDDDLKVITWFVATYGGERCGAADAQVQYCQAALLGRDLVRRLSAQVAAPPPAR